MSLESSLSRQLDIRFIDARKLVNEAKLNLQIVGYAEGEQVAMLREEALRLFDEHHTTTEQLVMKRAHWDLEASKYPVGSSALSSWHDSGLGDLSSSDDFLGTSIQSTASDFGTTWTLSSSMRSKKTFRSLRSLRSS